MTYYILLALFPGITALVSIYGLVADPADIGEHLASLSGTIPSDAISIISGQLHFLASQDEKALGLAFFGGLLVSLWSANAAMKALFDALNVVYGEKRNATSSSSTRFRSPSPPALCFFWCWRWLGSLSSPRSSICSISGR